jgi:hypothetical protein
MNFFDKLKASAKRKWLDYYGLNSDWLIKCTAWKDTPDGGKRPQATLILGVVTALEPRLIEFLPALVDLNNNLDEIIRTFGLNFDPRIELEKRSAEIAASQETETTFVLTDLDTEYLNKIREETKT